MKTEQILVATCAVATPLGEFAAHYSDAGLARLDFPGGKVSESPGISPSVRRWHKHTSRAVSRILEGRAPGELPPLDISQGTPFQKKVWAALQEIPPGQTKSYGEVGAGIGTPGAARAVGGACGANPIPLLIPCHRVLAAGGRLGGFSGGLDWKRRLLAREWGI
jgi:O-6-methylguanine DNA methyltransferase